MGLASFWLWDLWLFMGFTMTGFAAVFLLIMCVIVAFEGRQAWREEWHWILATMVGIGWAFPLLIAALPFVFIYRVVTGR